MNDLRSDRDLASAGQTAGEGDKRSIADLLIDQVEFADILVLNKTDCISTDDLGELLAFVEQLNPYALKLDSSFGNIDPKRILGTGRFDFERAKLSRGWQLTMRGDGASEVEEYGVSNFVYKARRPFHPQRFYDRLHGDWSGVLRFKRLLLVGVQTRPRRSLVSSWSNCALGSSRLLVGSHTERTLA